MEMPFTMPKLGATMTEGTVLHWLYQPGDCVAKGEPIVEIMTDKVNLEVESPISGRLIKILARDGDLLPVGKTLAILADDSSNSSETVVAANQEVLRAIPVASTPAAKREAALYGIDLHSVISAGARPPLNRNDVIAFVMRASQHEEVKPPVRPEVRATPVAQKIATEHQIDLVRVAERRPGEKLTRADVESHLVETTQQVPELEQAMLSVLPTVPQNIPHEELTPLTPARRQAPAWETNATKHHLSSTYLS